MALELPYKKKQRKMIIILIVIVLAVTSVIYFTNNGIGWPDFTIFVEESDNESLQLDTEVFENSQFQERRDFGQDIDLPENVGRDNPFVPYGYAL